MTDKDPFKDAILTDTVIVKPGKPVDVEQKLAESLEMLTKNDLVELAEEEYGIQLDRRLTKQRMIDQILDEEQQ